MRRPCRCVRMCSSSLGLPAVCLVRSIERSTQPAQSTLTQELEAERQALRGRQAELQGKLTAGATLSKDEAAALASLEEQLAALRAKEAELPKEVS
jgi:hypothetical protein